MSSVWSVLSAAATAGGGRVACRSRGERRREHDGACSRVHETHAEREALCEPTGELCEVDREDAERGEQENGAAEALEVLRSGRVGCAGCALSAGCVARVGWVDFVDCVQRVH